MKRLLLIFLLTLLPLQMSWAAVSSYCKHENGKAAQHFGHHDHRHEVKSADEPKPAPLLAVDADCGVCQLVHLGILNALPDPLPIRAHQADAPPADTNFVSSFRPERPERPKWTRAA